MAECGISGAACVECHTKCGWNPQGCSWGPGVLTPSCETGLCKYADVQEPGGGFCCVGTSCDVNTDACP